MYFSLVLKNSTNEENIIKKEITEIAIYNYEKKEVYFIKYIKEKFKNIFEDEKIEKYGYELGNTYIILKQDGITIKNLKHDIIISAYILDPTIGKYPIDNLIEEYMNIKVEEYLDENGIINNENNQITLFESNDKQMNLEMFKFSFYAYSIYTLSEIFINKLKEIESINLFEEIDMPTVEVLADMQWNGMHIDEEQLIEYGKMLKSGLDLLTTEIYNLAGEEFNINSPKQLGEILFEKMGLTVKKKTKSGYSTAEEVLEKLKFESPIIQKILDYRQLAKLNSTYVEGLRPFINCKTKRIHSFFHQTITATRENKFNRPKSTKYTYKN